MNKTLAVVALSVISSAAFAQVNIYSNNPSGDAFTNAGGTGAAQQISSPTGYNNASWYYTEVKNGGIVGIDTVNPRNGNGSAHFNVAANGAGGRADMELRDTTLGFLGLFDDVTAWSVDTFTQSSDLANAALVLRLEVFSLTAGLYGNLVFSPTDTPGFNSPVTGGQWNTFDFFAPSTGFMLNATSSLGATYGAQLGGTPKSFSDWQTTLSGQDFVVLSANMGWGTATAGFEGFADNYTLGFGGQSSTYNFETVPEPMTMTILAAGAAIAARRRKKK